MKRPSFQFYPADWRNNANLRRCSHAARGAWMDVLSVLHDSDEYGIVRWPMDELANAASVPVKLIKELVDKQVLKGSDSDLSVPYIYTPRSGRKEGDPVTLIPAQSGPIWYSSRFVRDEYKRQNSGKETRFGAQEHHENSSPSPSPRRAPSRRHGANQGDGSTSSSSTSLSSDDDSSTPPPSSAKSNGHPEHPPIDPTLTLAENKRRCLADDNVNGFVSTMHSNGLKGDALDGWLDAFNRQLTHEGQAMKQHRDYRRHFTSWIRFQDFRSKSPADYSPVKPGKTQQQNQPNHVPVADKKAIAAKYQ